MTGSRPADVTIRLRRAKTYTHLEFKARRRDAAPFLATLSNTRISDAREQLDRELTNLKYRIPELQVDTADLADIYIDLSRLGRCLLMALFGTQARVIQQLRDFWVIALPFGRNPEFPPLVECVGDMDSQLPVEFLPLFMSPPGMSVTSPDDFYRACRSLVGFSCIVRRTMLPIPLRGNLALSTTPDGRLPLRYLYYEDLMGARDELSWFTMTAAHRVSFEGPYPGPGVCMPSLAEQIFDPGLLLAGGRRTLPDQVQHFSCHCYTGADDPFDNEIELSGEGTKVRKTIRALGEGLVELAWNSTMPEADKPLVFMNACGSARLRATTSSSFPDFFLRNGNRGFIGTEVDMPDGVAAAFSKALYERFLLYGRPLGRSLLDARNHLLRQYGNPLGLAYTTYADPEIHIRPMSTVLPGEDHSYVSTAS